MADRNCQTEGFVLRSTEYGERDLIVTLYGRQTGKISAIAKNARGSKRRFGGGLQPMRHLNLSLTRKPNRDLDRLDEIEVEADFRGIEKGFEKITVGSYATELFRASTVDENPQMELFDLLLDFYERLADAEETRGVLDVLLRHFQLRLFDHMGEAPAIDACLRCGTPSDGIDKLYALRGGEGVICPDCVRTGESVGVIYRETLDVLRYYRAPHGDVPEPMRDSTFLDQARRFVDAAERRMLEGKKLKSRAMLETLFESPDPNE